MNDKKPDNLLIQAVLEADPERLIKTLYSSGFISGLVARLYWNWHNNLNRGDIEDMVAESVARFYDGLRQGEKIRNPHGFITKVATNKISELYRSRERQRKAVASLPVRNNQDEDTEHPYDDVDWETQRKLGFQKMRSLVPQLGQENVQRVMAYIIDAAEAGMDDVSSDELAEIFDLSPDTVRQSKSRGLKRLKRLAESEGFQVAMSEITEPIEPEE